MKKEFQTTTHSTSTIPSKPTAHTEKVPVNSVSVDAVNFIMDNVFDWESQKEHAGLRMTYEDCKVLVKSLKANLIATCPDVVDHDVTDLYGELLHNNWAGQFQDIKDLTEKVVVSYLEAEMGNFEPITAVKRQMKGKISYMEKHYSDVSHKDDVPAHVMATAMDKSDRASGLGGSLESRKSTVLALIQNKRGGGQDDLFDGEQDPALLKIVKSLTDASTDEELMDALESFEDYMMQAEVESIMKPVQNTGSSQQAGDVAVADAGTAVAEKIQSQSMASRLKQKLPNLARFFMN